MAETAREANTQGFQLKGYEVLGAMEGGMSVVYKVRHQPTGRVMAAKTLKLEFSQDAQAVERFHREGVVTRSLQHRNIIRVIHHDCILTRHRTGRHFFIMEFVDGVNLQSLVEERGPMPREEIVEIVSQVCDALRYAHTFAHQPVIHRDLKSSNILIEHGTGRVVLTDFGIAQRIDGPDFETHLIGTAEYMSPEHAQGKPTDERSDLYALGVIMYEMAAGQLPFRPTAPGPYAVKEVLAKHCSERPTPPREVNPHVSPSLDAMIMLLLEKDPAKRYQSAGVLKAHLTQQWTTETGFVPYEMIRREARKRMRGPMAVMALMAPLCLVLGVAGYLGGAELWARHQAGKLEDRAGAAFREGNWDVAARLFREAHAEAPSPQRELFMRRAEGQVRLMAGLDKLEEGQTELALVDLRQSVAELGNAQSRRALSMAEAAANHEKLMRAGDQAMIDGKLTAAVEAYRQALAVRKSPRTEQRLNLALARQLEAKAKQAAAKKDWKAALAAYEQAAQLDPTARVQEEITRIKGMVNLGMMLKVAETAYGAGMRDEALRVLEDLLARQPSKEAKDLHDKVLVEKLLAQGDKHEQAGEWADAVAAYRRAARLVDSPDAAKRLNHAQAMRYAAEGDAKAKANVWQEAAKLYARALGFADIEEIQGKLSRAQAEADRERFAAKARACAGDNEAALAFWVAAQEAKPNDEAAREIRRLRSAKWLQAGKACQARGDWPGAVAAYEKLAALTGNTEHQKLLAAAKTELAYGNAFAHGKQAAAAGKWDEACAAFEAASRAKKTPEAVAEATRCGYEKHMAVGRAFAQQRKWPEAAAAFKAARALKPTEESDLALAGAEANLGYETAYAAGTKALEEENWAGAVTNFQEALKYRSTSEAAERLQQSKHALLMAFGKTQEDTGDWDRALEYYNAATHINNGPDADAAVARVTYYKLFAQARSEREAGQLADANLTFASAAKLLAEKGRGLGGRLAKPAGHDDAATLFGAAFIEAAEYERQKKFAPAIEAYKRAQVHAVDKGLLKGRIERCVQELIR